MTTGTPTAGTFPVLVYALVQTEAGFQNWLGSTDPTIWINLDTATGDALLQSYDGVIAERLGGSTSDIDGTYVATTFGKDTYHGGTAFDVTIATAADGRAFIGLASLAKGVPAAGTLYVELQRDAITDEITGRAGPFWTAGALPANTATEIYVPILESDGAGRVDPIQLGPIYWRPNP